MIADTRCIGSDVTFAGLKARAAAQGHGIDELEQRSRCGCRSGLCLPVIRRMMKSGPVAFDLLKPCEAQAASAG
jgi:hypothetical protein